MTYRAPLALWQWTVLLTFGMAVIALAFGLGERASATRGVAASETAASRRETPDPIFVSKRTPPERPARGRAVLRAAAALPLAGAVAPAAVVRRAARAPSPPAARHKAPRPSSRVLRALASDEPPRATSAELDESASVLERVREESSL